MLHWAEKDDAWANYVHDNRTNNRDLDNTESVPRDCTYGAEEKGANKQQNWIKYLIKDPSIN